MLMPQYKRIGIIGGLSPESTLLYYRYMIDEYRRLNNDNNYPEIIIYSLSFGKFSTYVKARKLDEAADYIGNAVKALENAGCEFALISANTPHMLYDKITKEVRIPLLNIIDVLAETLKKDKIGKVGVLGTYDTMTSGFYLDRLEKHGIKAIAPDGRDAELINSIIMDELTKGIINNSSKKLVEEVAKKLIARGAQAITLSCTELPLLFKEWVAEVKAYNTAELHARKSIRIAVGIEDFPEPPKE